VSPALGATFGTSVTVRLNAREELRVLASTVDGERIVTLRIFWTPDRGETWKPGGSRLAFPVAAVPRISAAVAAAAAGGRVQTSAPSGSRRGGR
jgi:hypothetical protein